MIVLFLVSAITFLLVNLAPGAGRADAHGRDPRAARGAARRLGLDQPLLVRYAQWLGGAVRADFGISLSSNEPVAQRIAQRLPNTLLLAVSALLSGRGRHPYGRARRASPQHAARLRHRPVQRAGRFGAGLLAGHHPDPDFVGQPGLAAVSGMATPGSEGDLVDRLQHLMMPALVLSTTVLPYVVRFTRSALLDVLHAGLRAHRDGQGSRRA